MADGTVRGELTLTSEQALRGLHEIRDAGREADAALESLGERLDRLSVKRVTPTIDLRGVDAANAKLTELEARLDRIGRKSYAPQVGVRGGFMGVPGGGGRGAGEGLVAGGSGTPLFGSIGGMAGRLPWWAALTPLVPQIAGGAGALLSSAGSAALGAGAVGLAGMGSLAAGGGLTLAIAKPAIAALGEITKAQDAYTRAVQEFGAKSTQAATASRSLNQAIASNPAAVGAGRQLSAFRQGWNTATAPARGAIFGGISNVLYNARLATPTLASDAYGASRAVAGGASAFSSFLASPGEQAVVSQLTGSFAQNLPIAERSLEHIAVTLSHLAVDALPFFHEANVWVEHWTAGMAKSSADQPRVQAGMQQMVTSAKDWARLTGAAARDIRDLFSPGTQAGNSMVVDLTHTLDRWDVWLRDNPDKVRKFFRDGEQGVSKIAGIITHLAGDVWNVLRAVDPLLSRAEDFLKFASGLGGGSLLTGGLALYAGYGGARRALGGGGPSAAGLGLSLLTGSPTAAVRSSGRGGGVPLVVPSAASGAAATRMAGGYLLPPRGWGSSAPMGAAAGEQLPLFAAIAGGGYIARTASLATAARGEVAFQQAYGGIAGARYAMPESQLGAVATSELSGPVGMFAKAGGAIAGAARAIAPVMAILAGVQGITAGASAGGGALHGINVGVSNALSTLTLGLAKPSTLQQMFGGAPSGGSLSNPRTAASLRGIQAQANTVRTPQDLRALQHHVQTSVLGGELSPDESLKLQQFLQAAMSTAVANAGAFASNTWESSFERGLEHGTRPDKAVGMMLSGMQSQVTQLGPKGSVAFAKDTAAWAAQLAASNPRLQRPLRVLMDQIAQDINQMNHTTGQSFKDLQTKVFFFNDQILQGSKQTWQAIGTALTDPAQVAQEKLTGIWGRIQTEAINALSSMGFSQAQARDIVTQTARGGAFAAGAATQVNTKVATGQTISSGAAFSPHARGGVIRGAGLLDTVTLPGGAGTAAPGEAWIANRHTMNALSSATIEKFGKTAWEMIRDEGRPHSAPPMGGRHALGGRMFATGGLTMNANSAAPTPAGGSSSTSGYVYGYSRVEPMGRVDQGLDFTGAGPIFAIGPGTVTESGLWPGWPGSGGNVYRLDAGPYAGQYVYNMEHVRSRVSVGQHVNAGQYIGDVLPGYPWLETGWANSSSTGPLTPYNGARDGTPMGGGSQFRSLMMALKSGGQLPAGVGGAFGGGAGRSVSLRAPRSGLAGIPGAMADQASRLYAAGLQRKINASIGGGGGISAAGFTGGGSSAANQALGQRMMIAAGWGMDQWPSLQALWTQESGWNANSVNSSSGAYGIPQCCPLDTEILTRDGWKSHDEVQVGDETMAFNPQTGRSEWTQITAVHHPGIHRLRRFGNARWSARCTPNHRWVMLRASGETELVELQDRKTRDRIVLARSADTGDGLPITLEEAALLGWIAGDGWKVKGRVSRRRTPHRGRVNHHRPMTFHVSQTKAENWPSIERAVGDRGRICRERNGHREWRLSAPHARSLVTRAGGDPKADAEKIVLAMSPAQRKEWLTAIIAAEGHVSGESVQISQSEGEVANAIILAGYLEGYRVSVYRNDRSDPRHKSVGLTIGLSAGRLGKAHAGEFNEDAGCEEVWCVSTELGSWTARQDGNVFVTGNSLGHGHPFNLGDAPAQIAWGLNYIRGRYGSPAAAEAHERSHNWYSRGGAVNWAGWNAKGGSFVTNGATMFGAGENGKERVTISPVGRGDGRTIQVIMHNVTFNGGDRAQLERVAEDVAGKIIDALDRTEGGASDGSLAGVS